MDGIEMTDSSIPGSQVDRGVGFRQKPVVRYYSSKPMSSIACEAEPRQGFRGNARFGFHVRTQAAAGGPW